MAGPECPGCNFAFDSWQKLRVHHRSAHGGPLPNRECQHCGERFYSEYEKKYCSDDCRDAHNSFEGSENPNYDDATETTTCDLCDCEFEYYPSEKKGVYCPECVESESWRDPPTREGVDHPSWSGGKVDVECAVCGESIERYPSNVTGDVAVCSEECRRGWLSESFSGPGHPNWKGGGDLNYGKGWNEVRRNALERDGYQCVVCSKSRSEIGRNPDVHHIVPVRRFVEVDDLERHQAHRLDNVVSLCIACHRRADAGSISPDQLRELIDGP